MVICYCFPSGTPVFSLFMLNMPGLSASVLQAFGLGSVMRMCR